MNFMQSGVIASPSDCVPIDRAGYVISKPGNYCLVKDIYTRLDFADHPAERALIEIDSSNVVVDMMGHRGGRARLPFQSGGIGFQIATVDRTGLRIENVTIKNGMLSDFGYGIYFYAYRFNHATLKQEVDAVTLNEFHYQTANIRITNVTFQNCKENLRFMDWR